MRKRRRHDRGGNRNFRNSSLPQCPICQKPIRDLNTSVQYRVTKTPAHFDCILKEIQQTEQLEANEKLCYLGRGSFGILSFRNASSPIRFLIRKRIQYEDRDQSIEWNKS
jgi:hypothetical protein